MNQRDNMKAWFKEMAPENPSPDFTLNVMKRVMSVWRINPVKYQPIISKRAWWTLTMIALLSTSVLFIIHSSLPTGSESEVLTKSYVGIDFIKLFAPINQIFVKLNNISPTVAIGLLAILALWFFDQLFAKTVKR